MAHYAIRLRSTDPIEISRAMAAAQLPIIGSAGDGAIESGAGTRTIGPDFTVLVRAADPTEALDRVTATGAHFELLTDPEQLHP